MPLMNAGTPVAKKPFLRFYRMRRFPPECKTPIPHPVELQSKAIRLERVGRLFQEVIDEGHKVLGGLRHGFLLQPCC